MTAGDRKNATGRPSPLSGRDLDPGPARGLLRRDIGPGRFHHARLPPSPHLATWVQHYWIVRWDLDGLPPQRVQSLPHPNVHMVIDRDNSRIHGIHPGRFERVLAGVGGVFGIKFRAGGFQPFLKAPVSTVYGRQLPLTAVFGEAVAAFETAILDSTDDAVCRAAAEAFFGARLPPHDPQVEIVGTLVDSIIADRELTTVEQLAARAGLDKRALQRLFQRYVGVGPKWVINRYRLHEAIERLKQGRPVVWTELALSLGYFDQAHFNRDFKALVGYRPADYARRVAAGEL